MSKPYDATLKMLKRIEALSDRVLEVASWAELLELPAAAPRKRKKS
jgi:hypothetical protein